MARAGQLKIRPYARLLTMLGEQLIKNERIALIELIKNAYDADSPWVKVSFCGFGRNFSITSNSKIVIEDAGQGMTREIIEKHWLNPATPEKKLRKKRRSTTPRGRVIQGEKGIGRFAVLKLGRKIQVITRAKGEDDHLEHVVEYDFSKYDDEFLTVDGEERELFIDDLTVSVSSRKPKEFLPKRISMGARKIKRRPHGVRIEISNLRGSWSHNKIEKVYHDIARLQSIFRDVTGCPNTTRRSRDRFDVWIYENDECRQYLDRYSEQLEVLLKERSVLRIEDGRYDQERGLFRYKINGVNQRLELCDPAVTGFKVYRDHFGKGGEVLDTRDTECGSFRFGFFVFDLSAKAPPKYQLDKVEKKIVRDHRIYLYRDGIRVYPYGEPDDDWLHIDIYRGTVSAGHFLSNDQVVGYVNITQEDNPDLKDKTNREGLIEEKNATDDFIALIQIFLAYIRHKPYERYRVNLGDKRAQDVFRTEQVQRQFDELKEAVRDNRQATDLVLKAEKQYRTERQYLVRRAETTEELAGIGLSVETASHDVMAIMEKTMASIDFLIRESIHGGLDREILSKELQSLRGMISFVETQLKDIQLLFRSSKQRRRNIGVKEVLEKVEGIYERLLKKEKVTLLIEECGSPLVAKTTDAVLLQLFLNLFDNAIYWLKQTSRSRKEIRISLNGDKGQLVFSDNGVGVARDDAPYIFEPFYSGKGEEGRGLGLYIARQLLERHDYSIELAELKSDKVLAGANFLVSFVAEES